MSTEEDDQLDYERRYAENEERASVDQTDPAQEWGAVDLAAVRSALVGLKPDFIEAIIDYLAQLRTQFNDQEIGTVSFEPGEWAYEGESGEFVKLGFYHSTPPFSMTMYDDGKYALDAL